MAQQSAIDLRTVERVRVNCQAAIVLDSRPDPLDCAVLDVSAKGARISLREAVRLSNKAKVLFVRRGETFEADVAWQLGFDVGLSFSQPIVMAEPAAPRRAA